MPTQKNECKYPNGLREARLLRCLTRRQLSELTGRLHQLDPLVDVLVSDSAVKALEAGWSRPRLRTMATLCRVLEVSASQLFPLGADDGIRNPEGRTRTRHS